VLIKLPGQRYLIPDEGGAGDDADKHAATEDHLTYLAARLE
jgi:hypothetical protein